MRHPSGITFLSIREDDQKRLRTEFSDRHIYYGFNVKTQKLEAWYKPENSHPYLIATATSVQHAIYQMKQRIMNDRIGAKMLLAEIDAHNEKLLNDKDADAMLEVRTELKHIASGRKYFTPSMANNMVKCKQLIGA